MLAEHISHAQRTRRLTEKYPKTGSGSGNHIVAQKKKKQKKQKKHKTTEPKKTKNQNTKKRENQIIKKPNTQKSAILKIGRNPSPSSPHAFPTPRIRPSSSSVVSSCSPGRPSARPPDLPDSFPNAILVSETQEIPKKISTKLFGFHFYDRSTKMIPSLNYNLDSLLTLLCYQHTAVS